MSEGKNNTVMLTIIGIATLLIAVVGATFAYFSAQLTGTDTEKEYTVRSATIGTKFDGGSEITASGIYPKEEAWGTKVFVLSNKADKGVAIKINVTLVIDDNDTDGSTPIKRFQPNALSYTLEGVEANAGADAAGTMLPAKTETKIADPSANIDFGTATIIGNGSDVEVTQTYTLKFYFKDSDTNQNENQGAQFKAHIVLAEVK